MEYCCSRTVVVWSGIVFSAALLLVWFRLRKSKQRPPGPPGWPVFGNMFDLGTIPHQTLYKLRSKYGPVVLLKLGFINTMVVQSAEAAAELFKNHDLVFADRKCTDALRAHNYHQGSMAFRNYDEYWRIIRRVCSTELLTQKRINDTTSLRRKCTDDMIRCIEDEVQGESGEVNLAHMLFLMTFNLIGNQMLSRDVLDLHSKEGHEFFNAMNRMTGWTGKPNVADFFPFFKWLDLQGIRRKMKRDMGKTLKIVSGFVKERVEEKKLGTQRAQKDFLDALLEYEGDGKDGPRMISYQNVNIILLEMFIGGSETTSSTVEWAMAELLRNPDSMRKVKEEVDLVVGSNKKVEESDINQLPYLQAVVNETLRLHPTVPLLIPRNASQDTKFMGYLIPKNTQVFVNVWGIGRDPDLWEDAQSFKPERFLGSNINFKGQNFEFIPFGSGRRICIGMSVANQVVHLVLASLVQHFNWELGGNVTPETIDMNEKMGITMRKAVPLKAIPKKRFM